MKIKKNDQLLIIKGKDNGKKGKVIQVLPKKNQVVLEGLNLRKKHVKPKKQGEKGQTVEIPFPIPAGNVKILCSSCQKAVRVNKKRICQKCKKPV